MFTGLIEEAGAIECIESNAKGSRLSIRAKVCGRGLKVGDSLAVNGCCLTVAQIARCRFGSIIQFDLLAETARRTNFQFIKAGSLVNLERPLRADARFGGHIVTGHIDGLGKITCWERSGDDWLLEISAGTEIMRYVVFKGSIAIDGISLTVAAVKKRAFRVWIIPHTFKMTGLSARRVGDWVNLETDILGKYVERFVTRVGRMPKPSRQDG